MSGLLIGTPQITMHNPRRQIPPGHKAVLHESSVVEPGQAIGILSALPHACPFTPIYTATTSVFDVLNQNEEYL